MKQSNVALFTYMTNIFVCTYLDSYCAVVNLLILLSNGLLIIFAALSSSI